MPVRSTLRFSTFTHTARIYSGHSINCCGVFACKFTKIPSTEGFQGIQSKSLFWNEMRTLTMFLNLFFPIISKSLQMHINKYINLKVNKFIIISFNGLCGNTADLCHYLPYWSIVNILIGDISIISHVKSILSTSMLTLFRIYI